MGPITNCECSLNGIVTGEPEFFGFETYHYGVVHLRTFIVDDFAVTIFIDIGVIDHSNNSYGHIRSHYVSVCHAQEQHKCHEMACTPPFC